MFRKEMARTGEIIGICIVILIYTLLNRSWGSSISIVSDYRLDDRDSIPDRGKEFFT
jgi:hypothetical protein